MNIITEFYEPFGFDGTPTIWLKLDTQIDIDVIAHAKPDEAHTPLDLIPTQSPFEKASVCNSVPKALRQCDRCKKTSQSKKIKARENAFYHQLLTKPPKADMPGPCLLKKSSY